MSASGFYPGEPSVAVRETHIDAELLVDQIADWLDTRACVVSPAAARRGTDVKGALRD